MMSEQDEAAVKQLTMSFLHVVKGHQQRRPARTETTYEVLSGLSMSIAVVLRSLPRAERRRLREWVDNSIKANLEAMT